MWIMRRNAFTLIELLVVVTIIAVLIAILMPAMSRAIYTARLVTCGSNLHQVGVGVLSYASDYAGAYPYRTVAFSSNPKKTKLAYLQPTPHADDRPMLKEYFTLGLLECPLSSFHDDGRTVEHSTSRDIHGGYEMYFGSPINRHDSASYMMRVTQQTTTTDLFTGQRFNVNILAADMDWDFMTPIQIWNTSHPDRDPENLAPWLREDGSHTMSIWWNNQSGKVRGLIDRNFLYRDGSVELMTNLEAYDDRMARIPSSNKKPSNPEYLYLPSQ